MTDDAPDSTPEPDDIDEVVDTLDDANRLEEARTLAEEAIELLDEVDDLERFVHLLETEGWDAALEEVEMDDEEFTDAIDELQEEGAELAEDIGLE